MTIALVPGLDERDHILRTQPVVECNDSHRSLHVHASPDEASDLADKSRPAFSPRHSIRHNCLL
ncbi:hypothetical protein LRS13_13830 [Svornostia abyssi]|uniref:Uncharacterized protein n=1 Tax=Svornostia abyssi TaxID=2898438 RepID=A0ABY5PAW1_9ACTN|nr:hypothetical protein LRS13_13830 [Parviterribacteraceae bacterium J379]